MAQPAYVSIASEFAKQIRNGHLRPGTQLLSHTELADQHGVSEIVIRKAIALLLRQGLVRTVERRGTFVAEPTTLVRVSPERQVESPEASFSNESNGRVQIERETHQVSASTELAEAFGIKEGDELTHIVTKAKENGRPVSISDTHQIGNPPNSAATFLEETVAERFPASEHAQWLGTPAGEQVKKVSQRFLTKDDRVVMISDVTYPRDRYDAFVFRMTLPDASRGGD